MRSEGGLVLGAKMPPPSAYLYCKLNELEMSARRSYGGFSGNYCQIALKIYMFRKIRSLLLKCFS